MSVAQQALEKIRRKLLDLTTRNNLLHYRPTAKSIQIIDELPDTIYHHLMEGKSLELLPIPEPAYNADQEELPLAQGANGNKQKTQTSSISEINLSTELPVRKDTTSSKHTDNRLQTLLTSRFLERRCKKISTESRLAIEETGSNLLYLALGFLEWYEDDSSSEPHKAPLILIPISIERTRLDPTTNCYKYVINYNNEDIEENLSLALKLDNDFNLILPQFDDEELPESFFQKMHSMVSLKPRWRVAREAVIGMFSFSKIAMYRDLDPARWSVKGEKFYHKNLLLLLGEGTPEAGGAREYGEDDIADMEEKLKEAPIILDADSSQLAAIYDVIWKDRDLVIEGPPGTGKSQTIANIITAALARGKTVLFVAEKKAALDVVKSRLDNAGLGDFILELHSHKTRKSNLHGEIKKRLEGTYNYTDRSSTFFDELWYKREQLIAYSDSVEKKIGLFGEAIHEIFWKVERFRSQIKAKFARIIIENPFNLSAEQINTRCQTLAEMTQLRREIPADVIAAWSGYDPTSILPGDEERVIDPLQKLSKSTSSFIEYLDGHVDSFPFLEKNLGYFKHLMELDISVVDARPGIDQAGLAVQFIRDANIATVQQLDKAINDYEHDVKAAEPFKQCNPGPIEEVTGLEKTTAALVRLGHGSATPDQISEIYKDISEIQEVIKQLISPSSHINALFNVSPERFSDFERVVAIGELLKKAPADLTLYGHPDHVTPLAHSNYDETHAAGVEIAQSLNSLAAHFNLDLIPDRSEIYRLGQELGKYSDAIFPILSSNYRTIKRTVRQFLKDGTRFDRKALPALLRKMSHVLKQASELAQNPDYIKTLGPLYKGHRTQWERLGKIISWCREFGHAVGWETAARAFITDIAAKREPLLTDCLRVEDGMRRLKRTLADVKITPAQDDRVRRVVDRLLVMDTSMKEFLLAYEGYEDMRDVAIDQIQRFVSSYLTAANHKARIDSDPKYPAVCGKYFASIHTNTKSLLNVAGWVVALRKQGHFRDSELAWLLAGQFEEKIRLIKDLTAHSIRYVSDYDTCCKSMRETGILNEPLFWGEQDSATPLNIVDKIESCNSHSQYLQRLSDYCRTLLSLTEMGLSSIIDILHNNKLSYDDCVSAYQYYLYDSMAKELIRKDQRLSNFNRVQHDSTIKRFVQLDKELMEHGRKRVANIISTRPVPPGNKSGYVKDHSERALLEREVQKQRRHIPIRQLMKRAGVALQSLKPCFMMSPLSVAQYLEPGYLSFDLVVMDEASQIKPEDALGTIQRSKQVVVVGDPNQLPPTTFFDRVDGDMFDEEKTAIEETQSVLDICLTTFPKKRLIWHYRSDHPSLIAFSNKHFYDNDLIIFPSSNKQDSCGVFSHFVEGATYQKGRNRKEAEAIVAAVTDHFRKGGRLSLGVAAMNREQADLIEDILERTMKENPWLEKKIKESEEEQEPVFIKNLENVQGDERDVIFVSTTYGPDQETGKVYQRFGPIGGDMGWRRMNVLFTRAKKRVDVFTSMKPADIIPSPGSSRGVHALKAYLEYASTGILADYGCIHDERPPDSDFEVSVAKILNAYGYKTAAQVGVAGFFIDIGVKHPERNEFILGIECDGATYHSNRNVRDRDRLRQEILEKKGWTLHRIWSTDWYKNRESEVRRLLDRLVKILDADKSVVRPVASRKDDAVKENRYASVAPLITQKVMETNTSTLDEKLLNYKRMNILPQFPDDSRGLLRKEMLEHFVKKRPTTREDFNAAVPMALRQHTDGKQMQFLDDILDIIEEQGAD